MGENPIKILFVLDELGPGGAERRYIQLLSNLLKVGFEVKTALLTDIVHFDEIYKLNTEIIPIERKIRSDPTVFFKLYRICNEYKPDIIHAWGSLPAVFASPIARLLRIKFVNSMIASAPRRLSQKLRLRALLTFPLSDVIQSNSFAGLDSYGAPPDKSVVIHNGFDFKRLENLKDIDSIKAELNIHTPYIVGMVAGFSSYKDYESLIDAASTLLEKRDDTTFILVGDGIELDRMKSKAAFSDKIVFTGRRNDVESLINSFDIGVLSTFGEGISNSIMEYMALRKPVIASEGGGTSELVVNGETGYLIPQKSPKILAEKIDKLLNDHELRSTMGNRGRNRIEYEFSIDRMVSDQRRLYFEVLSTGT